MAAKKKSKKKAKSRAKGIKPAATKLLKKLLKVKKKAPKKKAAPKKTAAKKKPAAKKSSMTAARAAAPIAAPSPPPGERIGIVTHYYSHLSVAIIQLESGNLRTGETVHIKGHTSDFRQPVDSMEVDHVHVDEARPGQSFGLRVKEHAREHDVVYKVT